MIDPHLINFVANLFNTMNNQNIPICNESNEKEEEYINYLREIFKKKHPCQVLHELTTKLKLPETDFEYTPDDEYPWKCVGRIKNTEVKCEGYNANKKEAKSN
jgi:hypothetical protein